MKMGKNQGAFFSFSAAAILMLSCLTASTSAEAEPNISVAVNHPQLFGQPSWNQGRLLLLRVHGDHDSMNVKISVGVEKRLKTLKFFPDTGSEITWLTCRLTGHPAPPVGPGQQIYEPRPRQVVPRNDPFCVALGKKRAKKCEHHKECCYHAIYADKSSSRGVLVRDTLTFEGLVAEDMVIGCGYDQYTPPKVMMVENLLGLRDNGFAILSQLHRNKGIGNATGHCLNKNLKDGKSFFFFGKSHELFNLHCLTWTDVSPHVKQGWSLDNAQLFYGQDPLQPSGLLTHFDTGTRPARLQTDVFNNVFQKIDQALQGEFTKGGTKPGYRCWKLKGQRHEGDLVGYARRFLRPLYFKFAPGKSYEIGPESYLIQDLEKLCLNILVGERNLVGGNMLTGKVLIADNERRRIGWADARCDVGQPAKPAECHT